MVEPRERVRHGVMVLALPVLFAFSACHSNQAPIETPRSPAGYSTSGSAYSVEEIVVAVRTGLSAKRWIITNDEPGVVTGMVSSGGHSATVRVVYDEGGWTIEYVESSPGLVYEEHPTHGPIIHHRYNLWVSRLDHAIRGSLGTRAPTPPVPPPESPESPSAPTAEPTPAPTAEPPNAPAPPPPPPPT